MTIDDYLFLGMTLVAVYSTCLAAYFRHKWILEATINDYLVSNLTEE